MLQKCGFVQVECTHRLEFPNHAPGGLQLVLRFERPFAAPPAGGACDKRMRSWPDVHGQVMNPIAIEPVGLHWLFDSEPGSDLCAHGGLRVTRSGGVLVDTGPRDYALSTAALQLLRTLERDHARDASFSNPLVPHCGHFMGMDAQGSVIVLNCDRGVDWAVTRDGGDVLLSFAGHADIRVAFTEWRNAVVTFSRAVRAFFAQSPKNVGADDLEWFAAFTAEWAERHAAAEQPLPPR